MKLTIVTDRGAVKIEAHPSRTRGLAIHHSVDDDTWVVTHVGSGRAILWGLRGREAALAATEHLGKFASWTLHHKTIFKMKLLGAEVAAMRKQIEEGQ